MDTRYLRTSAAVTILLMAVGSANAMVRDSVKIDIHGQTRILRLVSNDAQVHRAEKCGANPTGVTLDGHFRLETCRPNGNLCGKLQLGELAFDHGDGWNRRKALILGDYDGDGHRWEVAFQCGGGTSNGQEMGIAGYSPKSGRLLRYRFKYTKDETDDNVFVSRYPAALHFNGGHLNARWYTNASESSPFGWVADVFSFDRRSDVFRFIKTIQDSKPQHGPSGHSCSPMPCSRPYP